MTVETNSKAEEPLVYLLNRNAPAVQPQELYQNQKIPKTDYGYIYGPESHLERRKLILKQHPQIAQLLVPSKPYTLIIPLILVPLNIYLAYLVHDQSWFVIFFTAYTCGGFIGHTLQVVVHDLTHWMGHRNILVNKVFAVFCNMAHAIPAALSFGLYHADHHNFFGQEVKDPDLPTRWQCEHFKGKIGKFMYMILLTAIYALRPALYNPRRLTREQYINIVIIICSDLLIIKFWGISAFVYMFLTTYFSLAHPAGFHVIAQHYEFVRGAQSYDYIGPWNIINLNVGYHVQHHDFPTCPWYNLPKLRAMAPEWYEYLPTHTSYFQMIKKFICDDNISLFNRIIRIPEKKSV